MQFATLTALAIRPASRFFLFASAFFALKVLPSMWAILSAPFTSPDMMWIVTPLLISMALMQLYFGRHRNEELGWNTAFGNSISLIFVSVNLLQFVYNQFGWAGFNVLNPVTNKIYLIVGLGAISFTQLIINYYHLIPKKIAFFINSAVLTNMTAFISIILVYTNIPLNLETLLGALTLLIVFIYIFTWFKNLIPMSKEAEDYVRRMKEKEKRKKAWLAKMELRQQRAADAKIIDPVILTGAIILLLFALLFIKTFVPLPLWLCSLIEGSFYIIITFSLLHKRSLNIHNLNLDGEFREALIGLAFSPLIFWLAGGLAYIVSFLTPAQSLQALATPLWLNIIIYIILLPVGNELVFRGFIQRSLECHINRHTAIIIQAVIFSLITFSFQLINKATLPALLNIPITLVNGIILGYLRDKWGLESSISAHVGFNITGFLLSFI